MNENNSQKFLLFVGDDFYPFGGWKDFKKRFNEIEEAQKWTEKEFPDASYKWAQIIFNDEIVSEGYPEHDEKMLGFHKWIWGKIER